MVRALRAFWFSLKDLFEEFVFMSLCNAIWAIMSLPLLVVTYLLFITPEISIVYPLITFALSVLPMAPATGALYHVAMRTADGRVSKLSDFFAGMRKNALTSWILMGTWVLGIILGLANLRFYSGLSGLLGAMVLGLWLYLLLAWISIFIYAFPLYLLQSEPSYRLLARNAAILALGRPIFTITTLVLMLVVTFISILMPFFLIIITGALLVQWSTRATLTLVDAERQRREAEAAAAAAAQPQEEKGRRGQVRPK